MRESNLIEGEKDLSSDPLFHNIGRLNPNDIVAAECALLGVQTLKDILNLHAIVGRHLKQKWVGKWRKVKVKVGNHIPPGPIAVPYLMGEFMKRFDKMNAWEAHNRFQDIHPFQDLNGRVGRLIWLSKAYQEEGYSFQRTFLHEYYYQTLSNQR